MKKKLQTPFDYAFLASHPQHDGRLVLGYISANGTTKRGAMIFDISQVTNAQFTTDTYLVNSRLLYLLIHNDDEDKPRVSVTLQEEMLDRQNNLGKLYACPMPTPQYFPVELRNRKNKR